VHEIAERGGNLAVEYLARLHHPVIVEFLQQVTAAQVERGSGLALALASSTSGQNWPASRDRG
jgi:hypothetical protein